MNYQTPNLSSVPATLNSHTAGQCAAVTIITQSPTKPFILHSWIQKDTIGHFHEKYFFVLIYLFSSVTIKYVFHHNIFFVFPE